MEQIESLSMDYLTRLAVFFIIAGTFVVLISEHFLLILVTLICIDAPYAVLYNYVLEELPLPKLRCNKSWSHRGEWNLG